MRKLILFAASGAGSGYAPLAPGTFGALVGLGLYVLLAPLPPPALAVAAVLIVGVGIPLSRAAEKIFANPDDPRITIDEVGGMLVSLVWLPVRVDVAVCGFLLFRLFDIWKPPPVDSAESLPGGFGVMADDVVAGIYANLCGQLLWRFVWPAGLA